MFKNAKIAIALCSTFSLLCCYIYEPEETSLYFPSPSWCGENVYDYYKEFCYDGVIYAKCYDDRWGEYNPETQKCDNGIILTKCGDEYYDERMEFCNDNVIYAGCFGNRYKYDPKKQKCENDSLFTKCGADYYNNITEFCYNDAVNKKCNGVEYDLAKQECKENDSLQNICKGIPYDTYSKICVDNKVLDKEIFKDPRDNKEYKIIDIGRQTWMAENLNYNAPGSKCYEDDPANCEKYGRLYDWATSLSVCPDGWHLSSLDEWKKLVDYWTDYKAEKLKAANEWNGTDEFGFSALPGGYHQEGWENFQYAGEIGLWWTSTENSYWGDNAESITIDSRITLGYKDNYLEGKQHLLSVRCVKD